MNKIEYDYRSALAPYMTSYIKEYEALGHDPKMVNTFYPLTTKTVAPYQTKFITDGWKDGTT